MARLKTPKDVAKIQKDRQTDEQKTHPTMKTTKHAIQVSVPTS